MTEDQAKERQKLSWEGMFYSMQRIDLLILSISGAGIYVCLESIKYLTDNKIDINHLIRLSGSSFLITIILNFLSQISGNKSNEQDYLMCQARIEAGEEVNEEQKEQINFYDRKSDCYNKITTCLNYSSILFMFLGLIFIMCYFLFIF